MLAIEINGNYLDLTSGSGVDFEKTSTLFDNEAIKGSSSLAIDGPLTEHNRIILGFPEALDNDRPFSRRYQCAVFYAGIRYTRGLFTIDSTDARQFRGYVIFDNLDKRIKDLRLPGFNYGGDRDIGNSYNAVLDHVEATAQAAPGAYDYVFAPVYNPDLYTDGTKGMDTDPEDFVNAEYFSRKVVNPLFIWPRADLPANAMAITPYPYLVSILRYVLAELGYAVHGDFINHPEIQQLCVYNNYILDDYEDGQNQLQRKLHLKNHVPDITVKEFFDSIRNEFCLYLDVDSETRRVGISFRKDPITTSKTRDLTPYLTREYTKQQGAISGLTFEQQADSGDLLQKNLEPRLVVGTGEGKVSIKCGFLTDASVQINGRHYRLPYAFQPGTSAADYYTKPDIEGNTRLGVNPFKFRLFFMRGIQPTDEPSVTYPQLTSGVVNQPGESVGTLSTDFFSDAGGYARLWQEWIELMLYTEKVERKVLLPPNQVTAISPYERIKAEGGLYILSALQFTLTDRRADLIEGRVTMYKLSNRPVRDDLGDGTSAIVVIPPPTPPVPSPVTVYVRFHFHEWTFEDGPRTQTLANVSLQFFSDPGGIIPYSVAALYIVWHRRVTKFVQGVQISQIDGEKITSFASGYTSMVKLGEGVHNSIDIGIMVTDEYTDFIINSNPNYEIIPNVHES